MRWLWIDRILEHEPGRRLVAVKAVSQAEPHIHDRLPEEARLECPPLLPASLIIEGMAQTAGILVGEVNRFREKVILAKIVTAELDREVFAGQMVRYEAELERIDSAGASTSGRVLRLAPPHGEWEPIGRIDLMFSHIDRNLAGTAFPEENFVFGENFREILKSYEL